MNTNTLIKSIIKEDQFKEDVLSPLANKIIEEITSNKLTYKQTDNLIMLVRNKIENMYITF